MNHWLKIFSEWAFAASAMCLCVGFFAMMVNAGAVQYNDINQSIVASHIDYLTLMVATIFWIGSWVSGTLAIGSWVLMFVRKRMGLE